LVQLSISKITLSKFSPVNSLFIVAVLAKVTSQIFALLFLFNKELANAFAPLAALANFCQYILRDISKTTTAQTSFSTSPVVITSFPLTAISIWYSPGLLV
jgi:hypothetical protein